MTAASPDSARLRLAAQVAQYDAIIASFVTPPPLVHLVGVISQRETYLPNPVSLADGGCTAFGGSTVGKSGTLRCMGHEEACRREYLVCIPIRPVKLTRQRAGETGMVTFSLTIR